MTFLVGILTFVIVLNALLLILLVLVQLPKKDAGAGMGRMSSAPNLQNRVKGAQDELAKHPDMKLVADGVFHLVRETPEDAAEEVRRAQTTNPTIQGWAMIGGWPLFTKDALRWDPGSIKVVAVDALPAELPYLESGHVEALYAQDCYGWGTKSVKILLDKIVNGKDPEKVLNYDPLTRVTKDTAKAYGEQWKKWAPK